MFQVSGHSVMQGQAVYFSFFAREHSDSAVARYINETRRVYGVLEMRLAEQREALRDDEINLDDDDQNEEVWLVGTKYSLADLSFLTWARVVDRLGIELEEEFPEVAKWIETMMKRPNVQRALSGSSTAVHQK